MEEAEASAREAAPMVAARARVTPASINAADRTVDVVWSTGARAPNYVPGLGKILEELDMSPSAVRMDRLRSGAAPVLDFHKKGSSRDVVGRVTSARIEGARGVATLQFSMAADVTPIWERVADSTIRTVSVGYIVHRYQPINDAKDGTVHRAVDWEPFEISVAPIPVDVGAVVRADTSAEPAPAFVAMEPADTTTNLAAPAASQEQTMADNAQAAAPEAPAAVSIDVNAVRAEAQRAERERISGIDGVLVAARGIIAAETEGALRTRAMTEGLTVEAARALVLDEVLKASRTPPIQTAHVGASGDDPVAIRGAMVDALAVRISQNVKPDNDRYREYMGVRASDMVRDLMAARGERNVPRNPVLLAERAFHSTSDFPKVLEAAANKVLLADYAQAAPTFRSFMGRRTFNDFKAHKFLRVGDFPALEALSEAGEIKLGTISEGRESITLATYAKGVSVTRQMLVNDDLGAFSDFAGMIGRRIMDFENATAFGVVTSGSGAGPNLADSTAVFTTARGNRAASGAAIDVTSLGAARQALRSRTSPDGLKLNLSPRYLLTGPAYETVAWQYSSAQFTPAKASDANPFRGVYEPIVDANITGNNWYLFADPAVAPVYVYGYLAGAEGPQTRSYEIPGSDGAIRIDVWLDFGVGANDWRGGHFNAGA